MMATTVTAGGLSQPQIPHEEPHV